MSHFGGKSINKIIWCVDVWLTTCLGDKFFGKRHLGDNFWVFGQQMSRRLCDMKKYVAVCPASTFIALHTVSNALLTTLHTHIILVGAFLLQLWPAV